GMNKAKAREKIREAMREHKLSQAQINAMLEAIKALSRREKVQVDRRTSFDKCTEYHCPVCGRFFFEYGDMVISIPKYCDECGQGINWGK
ncbi:MAG: hypothetical protein Q4C42_11465, partial [Clostridia bacterium]|nr:hypothetical protein [Clostridia bacterium]